MSCPKIWRRFLTGRGFGVHSPLAFRFIRFVLRDADARYYAFDTGRYRSAAERRRFRVEVEARRMGLRFKVNPADFAQLPPECIVMTSGDISTLPDKGLRFSDGVESYALIVNGVPRQDFILDYR